MAKTEEEKIEGWWPDRETARRETNPDYPLRQCAKPDCGFFHVARKRCPKCKTPAKPSEVNIRRKLGDPNDLYARQVRLSTFVEEAGGIASAERLMQILAREDDAGCYKTFKQFWEDFNLLKTGKRRALKFDLQTGALEPTEEPLSESKEISGESPKLSTASDAFATPPKIVALIRDTLRGEMREEMQEIRKELAELRKTSEPD